MKAAVVALVALAGCSVRDGTFENIVDAASSDGGGSDAPAVDAATSFGTLSGMCGVLNDPELLGVSPLLVRDAFEFPREFMDPADRGLLTAGGVRLAETPNAGGSSGMSEIFAFEQLARCEQATLLKTETEIVYATTGKITDMLVEIDGHKIGVSVTRAVAFPMGSTYTTAMAMNLLQRKLEDIQMSSANVSAADKWEKQILSYLAYDDATAQTVADVWATLDVATKADTILLISTTNGSDQFIYTNN